MRKRKLNEPVADTVLESNGGQYVARIFVTGQRTAKAEIECMRNGRTERRRFRRHSCREAKSEAVEWAANTMSRMESAGKPLVEVFTVKRDDLARMAAIDSKDLPHLIEDGSRRMRWVGIGWVDEGPADGTEVLVVD